MGGWKKVMSYDIKCESCGKFISYQDLDTGKAKSMHIPDTHFTVEGVEFICSKCKEGKGNE